MAVITSERGHPRSLGVLGSAAVSLGAAVLGAGLNLVLAVLVGRSYGAGATGTFFASIGIFLVLANTLKLGADTGLVRMLSRAVALGRQRDIVATITSALWPVLTAAALLGCVAFWNAGWLAHRIQPQDPESAAAFVRFLALGVPLLTLFSLLTAVVRGLGGLMAFALLQNVLLPLSRVIGVLAAIWSGLAIAQATELWAAGLPVLVVIAAAVAVRAVCKDRAEPVPAAEPDRRPAVFVPFWRFALPRAASAAIETGLEWLDVILVSALAGPLEGGLYAVATRLVKVSFVADYALRVALSTRLTAAMAIDDLDLVRRLYDVGTRLLVGLVWPYLAVLVVFGDVAVGLFGGDFTPGAPLLVIVSVGMLVVAAGGSLQSVLLLSGLSTQQLTNKVAVLVVSVGGNLLCVPLWGARGAAVVWVAAVLTDLGLAAYQVRRHVGVAVGLGPVLQVGLPAIASGLACAVLLRATVGPSVPAMVAAGLGAATLLGLLVCWSDRSGRIQIRGGKAI